MINLDIIKSVAIPLPDLADQHRLASSVRRMWNETRAIEGRITDQLELLHERRQALITAAAAGELEVPGVAA
jgi:type I restriction enzyme S subunit